MFPSQPGCPFKFVSNNCMRYFTSEVKCEIFLFFLSLSSNVFFPLHLDLAEFWASQVLPNLASYPSATDYILSTSVVLNLNWSWIWQKKKYLNSEGKIFWHTLYCSYFLAYCLVIGPCIGHTRIVSGLNSFPTWTPFWGITPDQHWHYKMNVAYIPQFSLTSIWTFDHFQGW